MFLIQVETFVKKTDREKKRKIEGDVAEERERERGMVMSLGKSGSFVFISGQIESWSSVSKNKPKQLKKR